MIDFDLRRIRRVDSGGIIDTVGGSGGRFGAPSDILVDADGGLSRLEWK